jgi:hypothetical protein
MTSALLFWRAIGGHRCTPIGRFGIGNPSDTGIAAARRRLLHVRSAGDHQHPRQCRRNGGDRSRWVGSVDRERLDQVLDGKSDPEDLQAFYQGDGAASSPEETDLFTQRPKLAA